MICIENVKKMSQNAPKSRSSSVSLLLVLFYFQVLMSCQVHLFFFPRRSPLFSRLPTSPSLRVSPTPLPGERCPDVSPEGSVPDRPELRAQHLFKVTDCCVPKSPLKHAAATASLFKKKHMFCTDQTPSHPHKAYQSSTREIIEELPQGNVGIIAWTRWCIRETDSFPHHSGGELWLESSTWRCWSSLYSLFDMVTRVHLKKDTTLNTNMLIIMLTSWAALWDGPFCGVGVCLSLHVIKCGVTFLLDSVLVLTSGL